MFNNLSIMEMAIRIPVILLAFSVHEFSHGLAAYKLGDSTAKYDGRLSLNPLRHIDPIGLICLFIFRLGWAKPVMVNTAYFKDPKKDMGLTAFAGPLSNFILAFVTLLIYYPVSSFSLFGDAMWFIHMFFIECVFMNLSLGFFNMLPLPPLDGSKIFAAILPDQIYYMILNNERIGFMILMMLVWTGSFSTILDPLVSTAFSGMIFIVSKIYFFL